MAHICQCAGSIVQSARDGTLWAPIGAIGIALLLAGMALFAFSGAEIIRQLPYLKTVIAIISSVFIIRGIISVGFIFRGGPAILYDIPYHDLTHTFIFFHIVVSIFIFTLGISYAIGLWSLVKNMDKLW